MQAPELRPGHSQEALQELDRYRPLRVPLTRGPHDANSQGRARGAHKLCGPGDLRSWHSEVLCGDGEVGQAGTKQVGQLHDLHLHIPWRWKWGRCFTPGCHLSNAFQQGSELDHPGWKLHDNFLCQRAKCGDVAQELDRIAEAVQTSDDHTLSADILSHPEAVRVFSASAANGVALLPGCFEVALQHGRHPARRRASVRIGAHGFRHVEGGQSFSDLTVLEQSFRERDLSLQRGQALHFHAQPRRTLGVIAG